MIPSECARYHGHGNFKVASEFALKNDLDIVAFQQGWDDRIAALPVNLPYTFGSLKAHSWNEGHLAADRYLKHWTTATVKE